mgnify:CR=1 FL=1
MTYVVNETIIKLCEKLQGSGLYPEHTMQDEWDALLRCTVAGFGADDFDQLIDSIKESTSSRMGHRENAFSGYVRTLLPAGTCDVVPGAFDDAVDAMPVTCKFILMLIDNVGYHAVKDAYPKYHELAKIHAKLLKYKHDEYVATSKSWIDTYGLAYKYHTDAMLKKYCI